MTAPTDADQGGQRGHAEHSIERGLPPDSQGEPLHGAAGTPLSDRARPTDDAAQTDHAAPAATSDAAGPAPASLDARTDTAAARVRAARQARQQARLRQAVVARPGALPSWWNGPRTWWIGLAVLAVVAAVAWLEIAASNDRPEQVALQGGAAARATNTVAAPPVPPTALPTPAGPEISVGMVEANGPVDGCALHPLLADFRKRIGANVVGDCVEAARTVAEGEVHQRTTRGEAFWRPTDQRMAFTDGSQTWLAAPTGIMRRLNHERFAWEADADAGPRPSRAARVLPPPREGSILPSKRVVTYYGNPLSDKMGILGEMPPEQLFPRLRAQAEAYQAADTSRPVVPALELVAVVAQADAGADGLYRLRMDTELIEELAKWADEQGFLLILDVQNGLGSVEDEVRWLMPFLKRPNVHLALDPEFSMPAGQVPGKRIGTMDAGTINRVARTLAELVESEGLPPKMLVVHRFTEDMVTGADQIANDPRVQVVLVMDGFGGPGIKSRQYEDLVVQAREGFTGFKLFYRQDEPLMTPGQVLILDPPPDLIIYQ